MPRQQHIVVIGASAGGIEALLHIVEKLPPDFPAPIFVTVHIPPDAPSLLPQILTRRGQLTAKHAEDGEHYKPGVIYVAPPDYHLLINRNGRNGTLRVVRGPRGNRHRPAIDPLFRSAAAAAGTHVIGVILSGNLDDGTAGLLAIKERGGVAVVQDPSEAMHASMPQSAIENVPVDHIVRLREIPRKLSELVAAETRSADLTGKVPEVMDMENRIAAMDDRTMQEDDRPGRPSAFSCPDCGGVLWEINDGDYIRFRCRVGHAFSPESMLAGQNEVLEQALWAALKTLEETARMSNRLAATERGRGHGWMAARFEEREKDARQRADAIRKFLMSATSEVPQVDAELEAEVPER